MKFLISLLSWTLIGSLVYYMSATTPPSSTPATTTTADVDDSSSTIMNSNKNNNVIKSIISMKMKNSDVEHEEELEKKNHYLRHLSNIQHPLYQSSYYYDVDDDNVIWMDQHQQIKQEQHYHHQQHVMFDKKDSVDDNSIEVNVSLFHVIGKGIYHDENENDIAVIVEDILFETLLETVVHASTSNHYWLDLSRLQYVTQLDHANDSTEDNGMTKIDIRATIPIIFRSINSPDTAANVDTIDNGADDDDDEDDDIVTDDDILCPMYGDDDDENNFLMSQNDFEMNFCDKFISEITEFGWDLNVEDCYVDVSFSSSLNNESINPINFVRAILENIIVWIRMWVSSKFGFV